MIMYLKLLQETLDNESPEFSDTTKKRILRDFGYRVLNWQEDEKICRLKRESEEKKIQLSKNIDQMIP